MRSFLLAFVEHLGTAGMTLLPNFGELLRRRHLDVETGQLQLRLKHGSEFGFAFGDRIRLLDQAWQLPQSVPTCMFDLQFESRNFIA